MKDPVIRFLEKVEKTETCWLWTGYLNFKGYGRFRHDGKTRFAHRVAYAFWVGEIPAGYLIDHRCHVRRCVNPSHLRLATTQQNVENFSGVRRDSTTGIRGVSWCSAARKWRAAVVHNGRRFHKDCDTIEEAARVALDARRSLHTFNDKDWLS